MGLVQSLNLILLTGPDSDQYINNFQRHEGNHSAPDDSNYNTLCLGPDLSANALGFDTCAAHEFGCSETGQDCPNDSTYTVDPEDIQTLGGPDLGPREDEPPPAARPRRRARTTVERRGREE